MQPESKLVRETKRAIHKLVDPIAAILEIFPQWLHDRNFAKNVCVTEGVIPLQKKIVICPLFQPDGLHPSTFLTVKHLAQKGYGIVAVSNCKLADKDLKNLSKSIT
jgi:hypothetical protein